MVNIRIYWVWMILLFLGITVHNFTVSLARSTTTRTRHHPTAVVVGSVLCDTCFHHQDLSKASHFISGATVAVECSRSGFYKEVKTNKHGDFSVHLPFSVSKHVRKIKGCSVKLISSSEPYCAVASTATSSSLHLKYRKQGTHIFSAGFFTFKPLNQPELCNQKPSTSEAIAHQPDFFNPIGGGLPLPPNPLLPPPSILPPNPFLPPPSIIPPIIPSPPPSLFPPLFPSPPPSIIPPIIPSPPRPPPSLFPPIPFIPGLTPSPPPPPPPIFPFLPLPPFPFQPTPGFPGVPPAATSSSTPVKNSTP